jgi:hypothetical protein
LGPALPSEIASHLELAGARGPYLLVATGELKNTRAQLQTTSVSRGSVRAEEKTAFSGH